jgi:hypothetical protein
MVVSSILMQGRGSLKDVNLLLEQIPHALLKVEQLPGISRERAVIFWSRFFDTYDLADLCRMAQLIRRAMRLRAGLTPAPLRQQERSAHHDEQQFSFHGPTEIEVGCSIAFAALAQTTRFIFEKRSACQ